MSKLYFEDIVLGATYQGGSRTLSEQDIAQFASLSGDLHPIHTDPDYAAATEFGRVIAHGPFGIALAIGLFGSIEAFRDTAILMTSVENWRFRAPVFAGDTIRMTMEVTRKSVSRTGRGLVMRHFRLINGDGIVVQEGMSEMVVLHRLPEQSS